MAYCAVFFSALALTACGGGERVYRAPSVSGDASGMSDQTLCYRGAYAKHSDEIRAEIRARRLDCAAELEGDPLAVSGGMR